MEGLNVTADYIAIVAALLFLLGLLGVFLRSHVLVMLMGVELMLNAANLLFVAYSRLYAPDASIYILAFMIMALAAAEVAIGLALILNLFRNRAALSVQSLDLLKEQL